MRMWITGLLSLSCFAQSQPLPRTTTTPAQDGGVREVLESIVIPPILHAPFTATLDTEATKYGADGSTMTFVNERRIARDDRGRIYQERWFLVPKDSNVKSTMNWIQIADPTQRTLYNCSTQRHVCDLLVYDPSNDLAAAKLLAPASRTITGETGSRTWEDLGTRSILGIDTTGVRETTITNPGTMGNDQPLTSTSEYWHSEQLGFNLFSQRSSPFFGRQTFTITDLTPGEPDAQLFHVPVGYKVNDQRKSAPISQ